MERKVKYDYEFKLRCVEEVLKKHQSVRGTAISNQDMSTRSQELFPYTLSNLF